MQRRILRWTMAPVALFALAACTVTIHISDRVDRTVEPTEFSGVPLTDAALADGNVTLSGGERLTYQLNVDSTGGNEALYIALDENESWDEDVELRVYNQSSSVHASASIDDFFARGSLGLQRLSGTSTELEPQVTSNLACPGSCVIIPSDTGTLYFDVRNVGSTSRTFDVYAILRNFEDQNEPNNSANEASVLDSLGAEGSLEVFGDEDVFEVQADGDYSFSGASASGIEYHFVVYGSSDLGAEPVDTYESGDTVFLFSGDFVVVKSANDRAAVAGKSLYFLAYQN